MDNKHFTLRPLEAKDASRMVEMMHDELTTRYLQIGGSDYTEATALRFIAQATDETQHLHRAVVDENDVYQGTVSLKNINHSKKDAEYAISIHPDAQGKGAAKAATQGILEIAFQTQKLHSIYLNVLADNLRATRFYQKFGFRFTHSTTMVFHGEEKTLHWYVQERF